MGEKSHGGSKANLLGGDPRPELVDLFSNENHVTDKTPPMFLAHAKNDTVVSPDNSRMLYEALKAHKVAAEYLELPTGSRDRHELTGRDDSASDVGKRRPSSGWRRRRPSLAVRMPAVRRS